MGYVVKEVFATLQGEGFNTGRVSVFCRFAGCNLWTGRLGAPAAGHGLPALLLRRPDLAPRRRRVTVTPTRFA